LNAPVTLIRLGFLLLGVDHTVVDRLLLLLEQILGDELAPSAAACVHQRATLVELSQLDGCEPELFGQGRHGSGRVLVVARQLVGWICRTRNPPHPLNESRRDGRLRLMANRPPRAS
jgi:hypothetical protein